jgi:hypothetical protein
MSRILNAAACTLAALAAIGLSACAPASAASDGAAPTSAAPSETVTPTPIPTPSTNLSYTSLTELRDATVMAGYACPNWDQDDEVDNASESGSCTDSDVFTLYDTDADLRAQVQTYRNLAEEWPDSETKILVGPNWILSLPVEAFDNLQLNLGGTELDAVPSVSTDDSSDSATVTGPEDFTTAQDLKFIGNLGSGLPTLVANVDEDTLTALGRQAAYVLATEAATEEQVVEVFTDSLTNYDESDGRLFVAAVQESYLS